MIPTLLHWALPMITRYCMYKQAHDDGWADGDLDGVIGAFPLVYTEQFE